jgi:predicted transcriptional regulator
MTTFPAARGRAPAKRTQVHPYLPPELGKRLRTFADRKGSSQGSVIETALTRYFDDANEGPIITRRLDRLSRAVNRVHRDVTVVADALAIYVKTWLGHTPPVAEPDRLRAARSAAGRFVEFTEQVAAQVSSGRSIVADLVRDQEPDTEVSGTSRPDAEGGRP